MNKTRWLVIGILLAVILIGLSGYSYAYFSDTETSTQNQVIAGNWTNPAYLDFAWYYRRPITITNPQNVALNNYPLQLLNLPWISNSDPSSSMKSDFSDLRFTDSTGTNLIPYWIESYVPSTSAVVWVRISSIAGNGTATIYMYYGNGLATSLSDPSAFISSAATYTYYQDFESSNGTWTEINGTRGSLDWLTVPNGYLGTRALNVNKSSTQSGTYGGFRSVTMPATTHFNVSLMAKPQQTNQLFEIWLSNGVAYTSAGPRIGFNADATIKYFDTAWKNFYTTVPFATNDYYNIQILNAYSTAHTYSMYINNQQVFNQSNSAQFAYDYNITPNRLAVVTGSTTGIPKMYVDYIRIWPYVSHVLGDEQ
jgi:predicted ribosomally synthesized peptide with SipW-like signal peptide